MMMHKGKKQIASMALLGFCFTFVMALFIDVKPAQALFSCPPPCVYCAELLRQCDEASVETSDMQKKITNDYITEEFVMQREWMIKVFFEQHILPAMMLFAEQISAMAMHQMVVVGSFLDAKQQLETQRLFQELTARAHKDYQPSEGMCTFGTNVRSLAASDRNIDLTAMGVSNRMRARELLSGNTLVTRGSSSDFLSRVKKFREVYCNPRDNGGGEGTGNSQSPRGLELLCPSPTDPTRFNKDIDYSATFDAPLTLKLDLSAEGDADVPGMAEARAQLNNAQDAITRQAAQQRIAELSGSASPDEEDIFALSANLYAHIVPPDMPRKSLMKDGVINDEGIRHYMNIRSLAAKRSVATNSFAAIAAMKSQGEREVQPYLYALMKEMGVGGGADGNEEDIEKYLGDRPSYYAQMEMLTKKLYQNPSFYTELYDKPANVERKNVSMQAIELMQKRDIYRSILRSEAILSVMLETSLLEDENKVFNEIPKIDPSGVLVEIPD